MQIHLLTYNNIEGNGLSVLLGNEGYKVNLISQPEKTYKHIHTNTAPSLFLINVEFLSANNPIQLLGNLNPLHAVILFGKLDQLHWLTKIPTDKKGFVCKRATFAYLLELLQKIDDQPKILDQFVQIFLQKTNLQKHNILLQTDLQKPFSKTELLIMGEISKGNTAKQIAQTRHISTHTIYNHRKNINRKFNPAHSIDLSEFCTSRKEAIQTLISINQELIA